MAKQADELDAATISKVMAVIGKRGGDKSAAGRMKKMTAEQRSEVARKAAAASAVVRSAKAKKKATKKSKGRESASN